MWLRFFKSQFLLFTFLFMSLTSTNLYSANSYTLAQNYALQQQVTTQKIIQVSEKGKLLASFLDKLDVEHHWLPFKHVNWITGEVDSNRKSETHCSAFVAAVALKLNIYILRPPEHSLYLLANAQNEWLKTKGQAYGWRMLSNYREAQNMANQGYLVLASYKNPNPKKPGHIVIIRPFKISCEKLNTEGPQIIQAGMKNYNSASISVGFKSHPNAWCNNKISFFAHQINK